MARNIPWLKTIVFKTCEKNYSSDISCTNSSNVRPKAVAIAVTVRSDGLLWSRSNKLI